MRGPLTGVRVLDLSRITAGPYGSMILGDLGAEVIKIEPPEGDIIRTQPGPNHKGVSNMFLALNRNKKSIILDLGTEAGREAFYDLVKVSNVVWDNFRPGVMARLGADYDTLNKINSRIICCSITGFGSSGPYRDRPSFDIIALALSGFMSLNGEPDRPPVRPGPAIADLTSAIFGTVGVMAALIEQERTGVGQKVETSQLDVCLSLMGYYFTYYLLGGGVPRPLGSGHLTTVPFGAFSTKEGYLVLGPCWPRICRVLGAEWLIDDPRFATPQARVNHREELNSILTEYFLKEKAEDWIEILHAEDIPAAPVNTVDKVVIDPQVLHSGMILSLEHPLGGEIKLPGNPVKMPSINQKDYSAPPILGGHTDEVLTELLGYTAEKIERLKEEEERHKEERQTRLHKFL